jgi:hypothetical protein
MLAYLHNFPLRHEADEFGQIVFELSNIDGFVKSQNSDFCSM